MFRNYVLEHGLGNADDSDEADKDAFEADLLPDLVPDDDSDDFTVFKPSSRHYNHLRRLLADRGFAAWGVDSKPLLISDHSAVHTEQRPGRGQL